MCEMGVIELNEHVIEALKKDKKLNDVVVRGEISNFKYSGPHAYFSLVESDSLVNCVMFNAAYKLKRRNITDGTLVKAHGSIRVYAKRGIYQLYAESIKEGTDYGALYKKLEDLKKKLESEGIFDKPKKPIPTFPKRIAVVSSRTSAAFRDVLNTVKKRYPLAEVMLFHTGVQGREAIEETVKALSAADKSNADVVLLVRGGGSVEDLWNFNEEIVVRKVYNMKKPVVTGVGHETDTTLVDHVADLRAPTPTGAAERATPDLLELSKGARLKFQRIWSETVSKISNVDERASHVYNRLKTLSPKRLLALKLQRLNSMMNEAKRNFFILSDQKGHLVDRAAVALKHAKPVRMMEVLPERTNNDFDVLKRIISTKIDRKASDVNGLEIGLKAHDPKIPLKKGYSLIYSRGLLVRSVSQIKSGDFLKIMLSDGEVSSKVEEVRSGREKDR